MTWRWTDRVALGLFSVAWLSLVVFHFVPVTSRIGTAYSPATSTIYGWELWGDWWHGIVHLDRLDFSWPNAPIWAALHLVLLVLLSSPFLIGILRSNRLIWWLFAVMSAMAVIGITGVLGWVVFTLSEYDRELTRFEVGFWMLMAAPVVHFVGVMFVRRRHLDVSSESRPGGPDGN